MPSLINIMGVLLVVGGILFSEIMLFPAGGVVPCVILSIILILIPAYLRHKFFIPRHIDYFCSLITMLPVFFISWYNRSAEIRDIKEECAEVPAMSPEDTLYFRTEDVLVARAGILMCEGVCWTSFNNKGISSLLRIYGGPDLPYADIRTGDVIILKGWATGVLNPIFMSPSRRENLIRNKICVQITASSRNMISILKRERYGFAPSFLLRIKEYVIKGCMEADISPETRSILVSLLVGERQFIDRDLNRAFRTAGIIHFLSISGMHVGLLYYFITFLLNVFFVKSKVIITMITLPVIWIYAFICGLQMATLRAALMFSIIQFNETLQRNFSMWNALTLSCFLQLLLFPSALFDAGFQLSYVCMFGLMLFNHLKFKVNWLDVDNFILRHIIDSCGAALFAQLFATPVSLYHFGGFPTYFLLSNMILMIPLTFFTLLSFLCMISMGIPYISSVFFFVADISWQAIETTVKWISSLPYAYITNMYIDFLSLLFIFLILLLIFIEFNKKEYRVYSIISVIILYVLISGVKTVLISDEITISIIAGTNLNEFKVSNEEKLLPVRIDRDPVYMFISTDTLIVTRELAVESQFNICRWRNLYLITLCHQCTHQKNFYYTPFYSLKIAFFPQEKWIKWIE